MGYCFHRREKYLIQEFFGTETVPQGFEDGALNIFKFAFQDRLDNCFLVLQAGTSFCLKRSKNFPVLKGIYEHYLKGHHKNLPSGASKRDCESVLIPETE